MAVACSPGTATSSDELCLADLSKVFSKLYAANLKWFNLGLQLDLDPNELQKIKMEHHDVGDQFREMLTVYLQRTSPRPSRKAIVEALRDNTVGLYYLAEEFEKTVCLPPVTKRSLSDSATTSRDPSPLSKNQPVDQPVVASTYPLVPREQLSEKVFSSQCATSSSPRASGDSIAEVQKQPSQNGFEYLDVSNLDEQDREKLMYKLWDEYEDIKDKYARLKNRILETLINRKVTVERLVAYLIEFTAIQTQGTSRKRFEACYREIRDAGSISKIFIILSEYGSFFYYKIVADIAKHFGTEDDQKELEKYKVDLAEYCKRSIYECPAFSPSNKERAESTTHLVMKVDDNVRECHTMQSLRHFEKSVSKILNVEGDTIQLRTVEEGCLKLTYDLPHFLKEAVFPLSEEQKVQLQEIGVVRLVCGDYCFGNLQEKEPTAEVEHPSKGVSGAQKGDNNRSPAKVTDIPSPSSTASPEADMPRAKQRTQSSGSSQSTDGERKRGACLTHRLLGYCRFGDNCDYKHGEIVQKPAIEYVPLPHQNFTPPIGKKGHSPARKGYIVAKSDRDPTREVKVVAEDTDAIEYAKSVIFKAKPQQSPPCTNYTLLGRCRNGDRCRFKHSTIIRSPSIGYVSHPVGMIPERRRFTGHSGVTPSGKCFRTVRSDRNPDKEVKVLAEDDETLKYAKKDVAEFFNKAHTVQDCCVIRCYIHPEAVETPNVAIDLRPEIPGRAHDPMTKYTAHFIKTTKAQPPLTVESLVYLNPKETLQVYDLLENPEQTLNQRESRQCSAHVRITREYVRQIEKQLRDGLRWIQRKPYHPKLEGRFGKCCWTKLDRHSILDDDSIPLNRFLRFLFFDDRYKRNFRTKLDEQVSNQLAKSHLEDSGSLVEIYDIKLSVKNIGKLDLRAKFTDGKPAVVSVKVDEQKVVTFDILCLHRQHDLRLSLNRYKTLPSSDPIVEKFLTTLTMPEPGTLSFVPQAVDKEWSLRILRHKKRKAYFFHGFDKKYVVTVTTVGEFTVPEGKYIGETITVKPSNYDLHTEAELHNLHWECAFAGGEPPESALALIMDPRAIPAEVLSQAPQTWTPEIIMRDFNFIHMLEVLNTEMDQLHT